MVKVDRLEIFLFLACFEAIWNSANFIPRLNLNTHLLLVFNSLNQFPYFGAKASFDITKYLIWYEIGFVISASIPHYNRNSIKAVNMQKNAWLNLFMITEILEGFCFLCIFLKTLLFMAQFCRVHFLFCANTAGLKLDFLL